MGLLRSVLPCCLRMAQTRAVADWPPPSLRPLSAFGFTAALLEALPFIGLLFSVSNRVGAAAWGVDLEKRQAAFRSGALKPLPRGQTSVDLVPRSASGSAVSGGSTLRATR